MTVKLNVAVNMKVSKCRYKCDITYVVRVPDMERGTWDGELIVRRNKKEQKGATRPRTKTKPREWKTRVGPKDGHLKTGNQSDQE